MLWGNLVGVDGDGEGGERVGLAAVERNRPELLRARARREKDDGGGVGVEELGRMVGGAIGQGGRSEGGMMKGVANEAQ